MYGAGCSWPAARCRPTAPPRTWTRPTAAAPSALWTIDTLRPAGVSLHARPAAVPPARQPELAGATEAQHQLGNDHIVGRRLQPRLHAALEPGPAAAVGQPLRRRRRPLRRRLRLPNVGGKVLEHALPRPPARRDDRARCSASATSERTLAGGRPRGRAATSTRRSATTRCCSHDVTIRNRTRTPQERVVVRVLGREPVHRPRLDRNRAVGDAALGRRAGGRSRSRRPPATSATAAAVALRRRAERPGRRLRDVGRAFFGAGTRAAPAAVARRPPRARRTARGGPGQRCSRSARRSRCARGESVTLRYAYGMAHPTQIAPLVRQVPRRRAIRSRGASARWARLGAAGRLRRGNGAGSRASSSGTPTCCARRRSTRRSAGTTRSPRAATTSTARAPTSARGAGRTTCCRWSTPSPRSRGRSCATRSARQSEGARRPALRHRPAVHALRPRHVDDLDFWLLLAAAEYGLGTRDLRFFDEQHPVLRHAASRRACGST